MNSLYTTHDIGSLLQVDASTVSKWIDKGILTAFRTPGGHRRVRSDDLKNFLVAHQMPVPAELGGNTVRLMVVDDDKSALDAIKRAFKPYSDRVELMFVTSGVEALLALTENQPHGLLLDLNMPDVDGYEVCRRLKARKQFNGIKVVAMSGKASADAAKTALAAGALECLNKPIEPEEVLKHFQIALAFAPKSARR